MENKLKVLLTTLILTFAVVLFVSFRPIKASADSLPISNQSVYIGNNLMSGDYYYETTYNFVDNGDYRTDNLDYFYICYNVDFTANGLIVPHIQGTNNPFNEYEYRSIIYNTYDNTVPQNLFLFNLYYIEGIYFDDEYFNQEDNFYNHDLLCTFYITIDDLMTNQKSYISYVPFENEYTFNGCFLLEFTESYYDVCNNIVSDCPIVFPTGMKLNSFGYTAEDLQIAIDKAYKEGQSSANQASYDNGYTNGYNRGLNESSEDYGITDLLFSVFDVPIEVLSNTFSFTIFGTTFWSIIVSMLALLVILWVVRLFIK